MKIFLIFQLLLIINILAADKNDNCRWKYKCCKLIKGSCLEMCEPEIECDAEEETTVPSPFGPVHAINVPCKFGYKANKSNICRRVL